MSAKSLFDEDGYTLLDPDGTGARRFVVLNDAPVGDGADDDLLEATAIARSLADLIVASRTAAPFTLAIDAPWGMGKSSLMHRLETTLAAESGVSVVWFNAWTSGQASALEGLIKSVLLRFDRNIVRRVVRSMSQRAHLLGALSAFGMVLGSFFGLGRVVDQIWRTLALDAQSRNQIKGVLRETFDAWRDGGSGPDGRRLLVVFIDDLDRCSSEHIIEVCEAIKLYLDVPGVVFVLACDQSALWRAVRDSAGTDEPAGAVEYLEKIIQINYRIPAPSTSLAVRLVDGYLAKSRTSRLFDDSMKSVIIERSGRNPRRIKRLINSFVLEYHLDRSWDDFGVEHLVKVVMLQHFYPGFYRALTDPRDEDPITEFLRYREFRTAVKQGGTRDASAWREMFRAKGIKPPSDDTPDDELPVYLTELERELPVEFPGLAADRDFVALVESLITPSTNPEQLRRLLRRPLTPDLAQSYQQSVAKADLVDLVGAGRIGQFRAPVRVPLSPRAHRDQDILPDLRGLRILWIDDRPETNQAFTDFLTRRGAIVTPVTDRATGVTAITQHQPDVVLSDFTRHGDVDAGVNDLEHLRVRHIYDGPVIFCSGQETPRRRRRAEELGALGPTNDENEILRWLLEIADARRQPSKAAPD